MSLEERPLKAYQIVHFLCMRHCFMKWKFGLVYIGADSEIESAKKYV